MSKKGLGRGIQALLDSKTESPPAETTQQEPRQGAQTIDIRNIQPNPTQPRQYFNEEALEELTQSIRSFGVVQPLLVTQSPDNPENYTIIAGERRFRAARMARLTEIPVIIKDYSETEIMQIALIENIQRADLTPIEEAQCYKRLTDDFFFSTDDIAAKVGKSKHAITAALHLLELSPPVQALAAEGKLTASHARLLLNVEDEPLQLHLAEKIITEGLSVRAAESVITAALKAQARTAEPTEEISPEKQALIEATQSAYRQAENSLKQSLGSKVTINQKPGAKRGKIEIEYYSSAELDGLISKLGSV